MKAEAVLRAERIDYLTTPIPKDMAAGCTIALMLDRAAADTAVQKLIVSNLPPEKVCDANWRPLSAPQPAAGAAELYLDHNATTPVDPAVAEAMMPYLTENFGNPSSIYNIGRSARKALETARAQVADLIGADSKEIIFTSCGSESNNTALLGTAYALEGNGRHIITSRIEHKSVLNCSEFLERRGFEITYLPVDRYGIVKLDELKAAIRSDTVLISIMYANNEIGTIQPIAQIAETARQHNIRFHTDAIQAAGKIALNVGTIGCDLMSLSAHKIYGPKGVGALFVREGASISPIIWGGHQERGFRGGTENISGIVGFGKAAQIAAELNQISRIKQLRDQLFEQLRGQIPDLLLNGHPENRLPNTLNISIPGIEAESLVINLDLKGIYISTGSACTSGAIEPSHVLTAMGRNDELAKASIRLSLGRRNTQSDIARAAETIPAVVRRLRALKARVKAG